MVLVDKRMLAGGIAMLAVGFAILLYLNSNVPIGSADMTEEEIAELQEAEMHHSEYSTLASILAGVGFLLLLISFGARKKKGGATKTVEKKPEA